MQTRVMNISVENMQKKQFDNRIDFFLGRNDPNYYIECAIETREIVI